MGHEGFAQESSLLYHLHSPSAIVAVERGGRCAGYRSRSTIHCSRATSAPTRYR